MRERFTLTSVSSASRKEYMYFAAVAARSRGPLNSRSSLSLSGRVPSSAVAARSLLHAYAHQLDVKVGATRLFTMMMNKKKAEDSCF